MCRKFEVNTFNNSGVITFCNFLSRNTRGYSILALVDELSQRIEEQICFYVCTYTNLGIYLNRCMPILRYGQSIGARG